MTLRFIYVQDGMKLTIFSERSDGDTVNLGELVFTDSAGDRPDLIEAFLSQNAHLKPEPKDSIGE